ncbi:MAG: hypothetical protein JRI53_04460 [Deltaproteobacteria bacterium]|nr:hypothetical protein [Deltaproteobacteria bacterium]
MLYELTTMSDQYTIKADDFQVAACACLLLGRGNYALKEVRGKGYVPIFVLDGYVDKWVKDTFGITLEELFQSGRGELPVCLDSIVIGGPQGRKDYLAAAQGKTGKEAAVFWLEWHDEHRSSMNDIGQYAKDYAVALRKEIAKRADEK